MSDAVPNDRKQKGEALVNDVDKIAPVLLASGAKSEELGTLSPDAVTALVRHGWRHRRRLARYLSPPMRPRESLHWRKCAHGCHILFPDRTGTRMSSAVCCATSTSLAFTR